MGREGRQHRGETVGQAPIKSCRPDQAALAALVRRTDPLKDNLERSQCNFESPRTSAISSIPVEFLNTVRVSCFSLGGSEFWKDHRLIDDLDGVVHGGQLEHRSLGEVAAFAGFPLVVLLDQD